MPRHRPYRPSPTCPHTYGVRPWSCPAIATEPCRPTACAGEQSHLTDYPPPFRHTPVCSWPRPTATVWRNLRQHPRRYETYTFSAKERDPETGLSYFGSRYYSSDLSVWLSVDPMSDKYPSLSPYSYCANNPMKLVDPNGEEIWIPDDPPKKNVLTSVKNTIQNVGTQIEAGLHQLDLKVTGTAENRFCEGNSDGANQGTITKRDVVVGMAAVATIVTAGAALEAEGAGSAIVSTAAAVNNIDDATVNSTGQTFSQRKTENKPIANAAVNVAKTATPAASIGSSTVTIVKNGVKKASACMADVALSTYSFFKSLIHNKKSNVKP